MKASIQTGMIVASSGLHGGVKTLENAANSRLLRTIDISYDEADMSS